MNKILTTTLLSLLLTSAPLLAKDYTLELSDPDKVATIEVSLRNGSVSVVGYEGKTIEISSTVDALLNVANANPDDEERQDDDNSKKRSTSGLKRIHNRSAQLIIEEHDNRVEISSHSRKRQVNLSIRVPHQSILQLGVHKGGDIRVTDLSGALELSNHRGAIRADNISGPIVAETHKKDIDVTFSSLDQHQASSLTSHKGSIDISLSAAFKGKIAVHSYKGEIYSGIDEVFGADDNASHKRKDEHSGMDSSAVQQITLGGLMTASVNGGGQQLTVETYKGNIYIRKSK